ncbi:MAG: hypothetical protein ACFFDH_05795 [Promethearchaeota archaeon]
MINYNDCVVLGNSRDDLEFNMTREEFDDAMSKRGKILPSKVKLKWRCTNNPNHVWKKGYSFIKIGYGCPSCREISYSDCVALGNSRDDLEFDMTREEFNNVMRKRGNVPPSRVKLRWLCTNNLNHVWKKGYSFIKIGYGCPSCREISYSDCVALGKSREYLEFDMTREEFNNVMRTRGNVPPSRVKLRWRCTNNPNHIWFAHYRNVVEGTSCPRCREISYSDCVALGNSRDDLEFVMTREEFNNVMRTRGNVPPNKVKLRWKCNKVSDHIWKARYNSIQRGRGCPDCVEIYGLLGIYLHLAFQYIITIFLVSKNQKIYSETVVSVKSRRSQYKIDSIILNINNMNYLFLRLLNNPKLLNKLGLDVNSLKRLKAFMFDYTSDLSYDNIKDKRIKYQKRDIMLFIVGTRWNGWIINTNKQILNTKYKKLSIIRYDLFAELIGLEGKYLKLYKHALNLYHSFNLTDLRKFSEDLRFQLLQINGRDLYSTRDLISDLQNMNIDYYSFLRL